MREQEFQLYGNYSLPFGHNKQFFSSAPKWADYLIGGIDLSPSLNWSSGLPFWPSYGECGADIPNGPCSPNKTVGRLPLALSSFSTTTHSRNYYTPVAPFGTNGSVSGPFSRPNRDQFGNIGRNNYFGPSFFNTDLAAAKTIPIHEEVSAQFRMDAFNVFNHINPANPGNTCIDCAGAGIITSMAIGQSPRQLEFSATIKF